MGKLLKSGASAVTASGAGTEVNVQREALGAKGLIFFLDLSDAKSVAGDTLDVYVQQKIGAEWTDIVHFTQILGNGADSRHEAAVLNYADTPTNDVFVLQDAALAAGSVRKGPTTGIFREKHVIVDGGGDNSFTYSVEVEVIK